MIRLDTKSGRASLCATICAALEAGQSILRARNQLTMASRKKIPSRIETAVLTKSLRRCCICFALRGHCEPTLFGQIAHLDNNPSNNEESNLAYLCLSCHAAYDGTASQNKGLRIGEVKKYRQMLHDFNHGGDGTVVLEFELDGDPETFTVADQEKFLESVASICGFSKRVKFIKKRKGSVILRVEISLNDSTKLLRLSPKERKSLLGINSISVLEVNRANFEFVDRFSTDHEINPPLHDHSDPKNLGHSNLMAVGFILAGIASLLAAMAFIAGFFGYEESTRFSGFIACFVAAIVLVLSAPFFDD